MKEMISTCTLCYSVDLCHCAAPRVAHTDLANLSIAHVDADSFYASVEKRDAPELIDKPVIVGATTGRGVVTTACYVARRFGVKSAMPMAQALRLCPDAVVCPPRFERYREISGQILAAMTALTPLVQPLSLDEAFLDFRGTEALHQALPAALLLRFQADIQQRLGLTVSIGLSHQPYLAKIASDMNKPKGFTIIGPSDHARVFPKIALSKISGVGPKFTQTLLDAGYTTIEDVDKATFAQMERFGKAGTSLWNKIHNLDPNPITPDLEAKSLSSEQTFTQDIGDAETLLRALRVQCEETSWRAKHAKLCGLTLTVKLKTNKFVLHTKSRKLAEPTNMAWVLEETAKPLVEGLIGKGPFRLLGIGLSDLSPAREPTAMLPEDQRKIKQEQALDALREKFGRQAISKGASFS